MKKLVSFLLSTALVLLIGCQDKPKAVEPEIIYVEVKPEPVEVFVPIPETIKVVKTATIKEPCAHCVANDKRLEELEKYRTDMIAWGIKNGIYLEETPTEAEPQTSMYRTTRKRWGSNRTRSW